MPATITGQGVSLVSSSILQIKKVYSLPRVLTESGNALLTEGSQRLVTERQSNG